MASANGMASMVDILESALKCIIRDGECFIRKIKNFDNDFGFALEVIDSDVIDVEYSHPAKNIYFGIQYDNWLRPVKYFLNTGGRMANKDFSKSSLEASEVIHCFIPIRPHQKRGLSWFANSINTLAQLHLLIQSELYATREAACKMGFFTKDNPTTQYEGEVDETEGVVLKTLRPGEVEELPYGINFTSYDPTHPNGNFSSFAQFLATKVAAGLNVAYADLTSDMSQTKFAGMRHADINCRQYYTKLQQFLIEHIMEDIFEDWYKMAFLRNKLNGINLPFDDLVHEFIGVRWEWSDPVKQTNADILQINAKLKSRADVIYEAGKDPETVFKQIEKENQLFQTDKAEIKYGYKDNAVEKELEENNEHLEAIEEEE